MKTCKFLQATVAGVVLAFGPTVWANEHKGEMVQQRDLPAAVQKTITDKAAGGKIVRVEREDDPNGHWNYEVVVKSAGKEWGFEVAPNGDFVKKHAPHVVRE